eukprot:scaffold5717_cov112-Isochrysis_galbana.AAC.8
MQPSSAPGRWLMAQSGSRNLRLQENYRTYSAEVVNRSRDRPSPLAWASHIRAHTNYGCTSSNLRRDARLIIAVALSADAQARWCLRDGGG